MIDRPQCKLGDEGIREQFPIYKGNPDLAYLDSAATTQKPQRVIDTIARFYEESCANIHRGVYQLSKIATSLYDEAREEVAGFLGAEHVEEVIFVRGVTEGINLIAQSYGRQQLGDGDQILLTEMEHHSNIVPWQILAQQSGAELRVIPVDDAGELVFEEIEKNLTEKTKILAITHVSNVLGTINPIKEIVSLAHQRGAVVVVDGAQAAPHIALNVQELDCDFYLLSGHKVYGPTGIGALYGKSAYLKSMPPYQSGGDMILSVGFDETIYQEPPQKFEAGTPNIAGAIALAEALRFRRELGYSQVLEQEQHLVSMTEDLLSDLPGVRLIGNAKERVSVVSFVLDFAHPHDIGTILDRHGVAVRSGHHCAQPLMKRFGVPATVRVSFGIYNTENDVRKLIEGLEQVRDIFL